MHTGSDKRQGSPPLTRGKVIYPACIVDSARITPAYAGKRISYSLPPTSRRDHPRLRGEKRCNINLIFVPRGSPPLTRGKGKNTPFRNVRIRITPAYAGKRIKGGKMQRKTRDHPRLRGEKLSAYAAHREKKGSPPLTRGKAETAINSKPCIGITPAYAGKSR